MICAFGIAAVELDRITIAITWRSGRGNIVSTVAAVVKLAPVPVLKLELKVMVAVTTEWQGASSDSCSIMGLYIVLVVLQRQGLNGAFRIENTRIGNSVFIVNDVSALC